MHWQTEDGQWAITKALSSGELKMETLKNAQNGKCCRLGSGWKPHVKVRGQYMEPAHKFTIYTGQQIKATVLALSNLTSNW
jgi:hypothetical protein